MSSNPLSGMSDAELKLAEESLREQGYIETVVFWGLVYSAIKHNRGSTVEESPSTLLDEIVAERDKRLVPCLKFV